MSNKDLGWKATIKPNPNGNWVRFSRSGSQSESGDGSGQQRTIKVDENTYAIRREAIVTVVQDESNITKQFTIVQDQKCFVNVDISGDEGKIVDVCGNSDSIVCDGDYAGVVIPAGTFGPNCSASEKIVTAMVNSDLACNGGRLKVTAKQGANTTTWEGHNVTAKTSPSSIVFPQTGGTIYIKATATRYEKYANCDSCPATPKTQIVNLIWEHEDKNLTDHDIELTKTLRARANEEVSNFELTAIQKGPNYDGWVKEYIYNTDDTVEILSLYSGETIIYSTTANRNEKIPSWLDGKVTLEFPYLQKYCQNGCVWEAAEEDGVITSTIEHGLSMFRCSGDVETNEYINNFSFEGDSGTTNMGRLRENVDYSNQYFTVRALADGQTTFSSRITTPMEYSTDKGSTWVRYSGSVNLLKGHTAMFRCAPSEDEITSGIGRFSFSSNVCVEGNIMSLLYGSEYVGKTELKGHATFYELFYEQQTLIASDNLILPATTLTVSCYLELFRSCKNMINCPKTLPGAVVPDDAYHMLFQWCSKLVTCPKLAATSVGVETFAQMFQGCTSLTDQVPDDLFSTVTGATVRSFYWVFKECYNLTKAPAFPPLVSMPVACFKAMYMRCTRLTEAPDITIESVNDECYHQLFRQCTSLSKIKVAKYIPDLGRYWSTINWLWVVSPSGIFTKPRNLNLEVGPNGIPAGWEVNNFDI